MSRPIRIGGSGIKRTLPAVARHADIWHTHLPLGAYRDASARLDELTDGLGRDSGDIERSVSWEDEHSADEFVASGATLFVTETASGADGYDFSKLEKMLKWRDNQA